jgi:hypothetical protein
MKLHYNNKIPNRVGQTVPLCDVQEGEGYDWADYAKAEGHNLKPYYYRLNNHLWYADGDGLVDTNYWPNLAKKRKVTIMDWTIPSHYSHTIHQYDNDDI